MEITLFSVHGFEKPYLAAALSDYSLHLLETRLSIETASLAKGSEAVAIFVNDDASAPVLRLFKEIGVKFLALRSAGFNHVDLLEARRLGIRVARVPEYSLAAIAEHTIALMLALNRKLIKAHNRVREFNFSLDGLTGFDMEGKTVGIIGTGKIGKAVVRILHGFGCRLLATDITEDESLKSSYNLIYTNFMTLCKESDIITLHLPMTPESRHLINKKSIDNMKQGVMLINTSRGALVNTKDIINALKTRQIGFFGMDVYEEEEGLFFEDHSSNIVQDDVIARLMSFQNVLITSHQAFLTHEALKQIASITHHNLDCWNRDETSENEL